MDAIETRPLSGLELSTTNTTARDEALATKFDCTVFQFWADAEAGLLDSNDEREMDSGYESTDEEGESTDDEDDSRDGEATATIEEAMLSERMKYISNVAGLRRLEAMAKVLKDIEVPSVKEGRAISRAAGNASPATLRLNEMFRASGGCVPPGKEQAISGPLQGDDEEIKQLCKPIQPHDCRHEEGIDAIHDATPTAAEHVTSAVLDSPWNRKGTTETLSDCADETAGPAVVGGLQGLKQQL
ncbi:hypothetical protein LTR56_028084 [Elasticomyces elasticus]|nr:hypothetical protein LTR56_028084 [Elasticomyces elasticus]